jgi:hypothetical protein
MSTDRLEEGILQADGNGEEMRGGESDPDTTPELENNGNCADFVANGPHTSTPLRQEPIGRNPSMDSLRFFRFRERLPFDDTIDTDLSIDVRDLEDDYELLKYIDDFNVIEVTDSGAIVLKYSQNQPIRRYQATICEKLLRGVKEKSAELGMKVNSSKTQLLSISTAGTNSAYIRPDGNEKIESSNTLKILGFNFSDKPTLDCHVNATVKKFNKNVWTLIHLRRANIPQSDLVIIYTTYLRPILEYATPVLCSLLTEGQSKTIENLQSRALKIIYGFNESYATLLERSGIERLSERRVTTTDRFAQKTAANTRFAGWFEPNPNRKSNRIGLKYKEPMRRLERTRQNPIDYMTRRLNFMSTDKSKNA